MYVCVSPFFPPDDGGSLGAVCSLCVSLVGIDCALGLALPTLIRFSESLWQ